MRSKSNSNEDFVDDVEANNGATPSNSTSDPSVGMAAAASGASVGAPPFSRGRPELIDDERGPNPPSPSSPFSPGPVDTDLHVSEKARGDDSRSSSMRVVCEGNREENNTAPHSQSSPASQPANRRHSLTSPLRGRNNPRSEVLLVAEVVENEQVIAAEPMRARGFLERKWKIMAVALCLLLAGLAAVLSLSLTGNMNNDGGGEGEDEMVKEEKEEAVEKEADIELTPRPTASPTGGPTTAPTFDPRPTLQVVQERGYMRCGMRDEQLKKGFNHDLCRAVAAVVVGDPDSFEGVPVTASERWKYLNARKVDLLLRGDTHTIEREVKESSTGVGFTFSTPFNYDGMVFFGKQTFVHCAEEQKRYNECAELMVCVSDSSTHHRYMKKEFPSDYFKVGSSFEEIKKMLFNNSCNVLAFDKSALLGIAQSNEARVKSFVFGEVMKTKEPLAIATRNTDRIFSDTVNWVLQALFFGEEQGLTKNPDLCQNYAGMAFDDPTDLVLMNAVYCVGNYAEIYDGGLKRGMNQINTGTGMLYAIPFGNLDKDTIDEPAPSSTLARIRNAGSLNCGVVDSDRFDGINKTDDRVLNMGLEFCRTLAAALLNGNPTGVNYVTSGPKLSSYIALATREIDVLVGDRVQRAFDFARSSSLDGFHFSTPYYYGNNVLWDTDLNDATFFSLATREDDVLFASFVNCVVLATIFAQENRIGRGTSSDMPLVSVFGSGFNWALRDAIAYSGSYDEIFLDTFGTNSTEELRGRNTLNKGGPMMHSLPHLP